MGDKLYLLEEYVDTTRCLVLRKTPRIPDRVDELVRHWESFWVIAKTYPLICIRLDQSFALNLTSTLGSIDRQEST